MLSLKDIVIRPIEAADNKALALIIRHSLEEFGANKAGTVYFDETTDHLYRLFQTAGSFYFVAEHKQTVLGGGGIFPTADLPEGTCELVKMYLKREVRGIGLGKALIEMCLQKAKAMGYGQVYIETMPELSQAVATYQKFGFRLLPGPLGQSGHTGCSVWMIKDL